MISKTLAKTLSALFIAVGFFAALFAADGDNSSDAFYAAIRANDLTGLAGMLKKGARVNTQDNGGATPLMYAAGAGSAEAMKLLLDNGADVNLKNRSDATALMWSATDIRKVRLLREHRADVKAASKRGRTALFLAAMSDRSVDIVRLLIAAGADVRTVDAAKMTALHAATMGNDTETIRLLINAGLDVNATDFADFTPLMNAASNGNLAATRLLLAKGAQVNAVSGDGSFQKVKAGTIALGKFTPLLLAATFGPADLVKTLLSAGAQVNVQDVRGMTPLMLAVASDHQNPEVIRALLVSGADPNVKSLAEETALNWARKIGSPSVIDMLSRSGAVETAVNAVPVPAFAPADLRPSVERSVALLERTATGFAANGGCASCHSHNITDLATTFAREKGVRVDAKAAADRQRLTKGPFFSPANLLERVDGPGSPDVPLYALGALASAGYPTDSTTDAMLANVVAQQRNDGHWALGGIARPPIEDGDIFRTALGIGALKNYAPPGRSVEMKERMTRAKEWLAAARPTTSEDRNMQLIGLQCAGVEERVLRRLVTAILATQRPDGGWAQRGELTSDAYATGQTLFALAEGGGMSPGNAAYQRGVKFLLSTQHADGSWYVRSRAPKFQPYFESGFPYGHDQWISSMATGWATAALTLAMR